MIDGDGVDEGVAAADDVERLVQRAIAGRIRTVRDDDERRP